MNVIDALVVTLGLDNTALKQGAQEASATAAKLSADMVGAAATAEKAQSDQAAKIVKALERIADAGEKATDENERQAKRTVEANSASAESFAVLGRRVLGLYALLTAGKGLKEFVSDLTSADAAAGRTARNLDMSGKSLTTWQNAATVAGGSAEGITGTLKGLTSEMQKAALTGQSGIIPVFRALGINLADAKGKARDAGDVLVDLNRKAQGMDPARFTELAHMAGIDDGTIALLEKSTAEFDKLRAEQQKYAATAEDIDAAQKRQSGWRELLITSTSLGRTILTALTPAITGAMKAVQGWASANQDWIKTEIVDKVGQFITWLKSIDWNKVGSDIVAFVGNVRGIASAFAEVLKSVDSSSPLFKAFEAFGILLATNVLAKLTGISSAISALGATALPAWMMRLLGLEALPLLGTAAVGAVLASGDPNKAVLSGGKPDLGPRDNDLGLPGLQNEDLPENKSPSDLRPAQEKADTFWSWMTSTAKAYGFGDRLKADPSAKPEAAASTPAAAAASPSTPAAPPADANSGAWAWLKSKMGFGDDPKVKDNIAETAKATRELRDIVKSRQDGIGGDASSGGASFGGAVPGRGGAAGMPNLRYGPGPDGRHRSEPASGRAAGGAFNPQAPVKPGTYRPEYKLSDKDTDDDVVNTIAGEAVTSNPESIDAVVNNMMNRLGTKGWGPSGNLHEVARAPGQYSGYRRASSQEADRIRERIKGIASGGVPDNTNGANSYRAAGYRGPWAQKHAADGRVVGGNRFAYEPSIPNGPYAPYPASAMAPSPQGTSTKAVSDAEAFAARQKAVAGVKADERGSYPDWMDERSRREMAGINAPLARDLLAASEATGLKFKVAQGLRNQDEANRNALSGRGVRNSQHLYGAAADIHIVDDKGDVTYDRGAYQRFADAFEKHSRDTGGNARWLGNLSGRWGSDIVHFDQGIGYGQSHARDPYGAGGPTKEDVAAGNKEIFSSPENPFLAKQKQATVAASPTAPAALQPPAAPGASAPATPRPRTYVERGKGDPTYTAPDGGLTTTDHRDPRFAPSTTPTATKPPEPVTYDHAARHVLKILAHAHALTSHHDNDNPIPVTLSDKSGKDMLNDRRWGAADQHVKATQRMFDQAFRRTSMNDVAHYGRMAALASAPSISTSNVNHHVQTRIGEMHVHTPAADGREFAGQFRDDMRHRGDVTQANFGLA